MHSEEAAFVVAVSDQPSGQATVLVTGMDGPRLALVVHKHPHDPAILRSDPQHVRIVAFGGGVRSPALPAIPFSDDRTIRCEVSRAARCRRCFRDIEATGSVRAEIGKPGEAAFGRVVIKPALSTAFLTVCRYWYTIGGKPLDLLRAGFINENLAGCVIDIEPSGLVETGHDLGRRPVLSGQPYDAVARADEDHSVRSDRDACRSRNFRRIEQAAGLRVIPTHRVLLFIGHGQHARMRVHVARVDVVIGGIPLHFDPFRLRPKAELPHELRQQFPGGCVIHKDTLLREFSLDSRV